MLNPPLKYKTQYILYFSAKRRERDAQRKSLVRSLEIPEASGNATLMYPIDPFLLPSHTLQVILRA